MSVPSIEEIAAALAKAGFGGVPLTHLERTAITNALNDCGGNRTHAAQSLGVSVRTLPRKLKNTAHGNDSADDTTRD